MGFRCLIFGLIALTLVDRLNLPQLATAQHLSRGCLRGLEAVMRNGKAPDFSGVDGHFLHLGALQIGFRTPAFDRWVAASQEVESFLTIQHRLEQEDAAVEIVQESEPPNRSDSQQAGRNTRRKTTPSQPASAGQA